MPRLERADMDGANRQVLASDNLGWPNGVTIDTQTQRVIWVDAKTEVRHAICMCVCVCVRHRLSDCFLLTCYSVKVANNNFYEPRDTCYASLVN